MKLYAVKSVHDDRYLPWTKGSQSKAELCDPSERTPRLFRSERGAAQAMRAWAKGIHKGHGYWDSSDDDGYGSYSWFVVEKISIHPQKHRHLDDVHVVEFHIEVKEISPDVS